MQSCIDHFLENESLVASVLLIATRALCFVLYFQPFNCYMNGRGVLKELQGSSWVLFKTLS